MVTYAISRLFYEIEGFEIRYGAVGLPIYGFKLMSNSNHMSSSHRSSVKAFLLSLTIGPDPPPPTHTLPQGDFSLYPITLKGITPTKNKVK